MMSELKVKQFVATVFRYASRMICLVALVCFGWIVASSIDSFKRSPIDIASQDLSSQEMPNVLMPVSGYWTFADTGLSVQKSQCSRSEIAERMDAVGFESDFNSNSNLNFDASDLIELAKSNGAESISSPEGELWLYENDEIKFRMATTGSTPPNLNAAAIAIKDGNQWQLMILKPQTTVVEHLLSLPADSKATFSRIGETGALQMELVSIEEPASTLLERWQSEGWEIQHTPWGSADSFSYLCVRDDKVVYAWSESDFGSRTLMLTASSPDTKQSTQRERD